jgi:hypothetical protein
LQLRNHDEAYEDKKAAAYHEASFFHIFRHVYELSQEEENRRNAEKEGYLTGFHLHFFIQIRC